MNDNINLEFPTVDGAEVSLATKFRMLAAEVAEIYPERDDQTDLMLSAKLANMMVMWISEPGTGKSSFIREFMQRLDVDESTENVIPWYDQMFNAGTRPTDIFGQILVKKLTEEDIECHNFQGRLVQAKNQFWDEACKVSSEMANCLLGLAYEGLWHNGPDKVRSPVDWIVTASNETFPNGSHAMQDRFVARTPCLRLQERDNRLALFMGRIGTRKGERINRDQVRIGLSVNDIATARHQMSDISISDSLARNITEMLEERLAGEDGRFMSSRAPSEALPLLQAYTWLKGDDQISTRHAVKMLPYIMVSVELDEEYDPVLESFQECQKLVMENLMSDLHELEMNINDMQTRLNDAGRRLEENLAIGGGGKGNFEIIKEMKADLENLENISNESGSCDMTEKVTTMKRQYRELVMKVSQQNKKTR